MATEQARRTRRISELQSDARGVVAEAEHGPVEIRRYGKPVAYVESVEQHREHEDLDAALDRAIWALDLERALRNVSERRYKRWREVAVKLRARYPGR